MPRNRRLEVLISRQVHAVVGPEVDVELGGMTEVLWPMQLFVPCGLALAALERFLSTGLQDPTLAWVA